PRPCFSARRRASSRATRQPNFGAPESSSPGKAATTPSRTSTQPARASRKAAPRLLMPRVLSSRRPSKLPARMQGRDAARIVAKGYALEAGTRDHGGEIALVRELADRFHEIGIGFAI